MLILGQKKEPQRIVLRAAVPPVKAVRKGRQDRQPGKRRRARGVRGHGADHLGDAPPRLAAWRCSGRSDVDRHRPADRRRRARLARADPARAGRMGRDRRRRRQAARADARPRDPVRHRQCRGPADRKHRPAARRRRAIVAAIDAAYVRPDAAGSGKKRLVRLAEWHWGGGDAGQNYCRSPANRPSGRGGAAAKSARTASTRSAAKRRRRLGSADRLRAPAAPRRHGRGSDRARLRRAVMTIARGAAPISSCSPTCCPNLKPQSCRPRRRRGGMTEPPCRNRASRSASAPTARRRSRRTSPTSAMPATRRRSGSRARSSAIRRRPRRRSRSSTRPRSAFAAVSPSPAARPTSSTRSPAAAMPRPTARRRPRRARSSSRWRGRAGGAAAAGVDRPALRRAAALRPGARRGQHAAAPGLAEVDRAARAVQTGLKAELDDTTALYGKQGAAIGNTRIAQMELMHVVRGSVDQFAAGAPPMQIFTMHLGMLGQAAALSGDSMGKFGAFMASGWGLALTVAVVALGPLITKLFEAGERRRRAGRQAQEGSAQQALNDQAHKRDLQRPDRRFFDIAAKYRGMSETGDKAVLELLPRGQRKARPRKDRLVRGVRQRRARRGRGRRHRQPRRASFLGFGKDDTQPAEGRHRHRPRAAAGDACRLPRQHRRQGQRQRARRQHRQQGRRSDLSALRRARHPPPADAGGGLRRPGQGRRGHGRSPRQAAVQGRRGRGRQGSTSQPGRAISAARRPRACDRAASCRRSRTGSANIEQIKASVAEFKDFAGHELDELFNIDNWKNWGDLGPRVLHDLEQELVKLTLLNPLKNWLLGENNPTLSSLFKGLSGMPAVRRRVGAPDLGSDWSVSLDTSVASSLPGGFATGTDSAPGGLPGSASSARNWCGCRAAARSRRRPKAAASPPPTTAASA
jgi:hypothetical protein